MSFAVIPDTWARPQYLAEQNHTLRGQVKSLRKELDNAQVLVLARTAELQKASQEIEVLARALELRAEDLSLDGSLRSGLLYEVAQRKEEARRLALEVAAKNCELPHPSTDVTRCAHSSVSCCSRYRRLGRRGRRRCAPHRSSAGPMRRPRVAGSGARRGN